jgi:hypothetical protein
MVTASAIAPPNHCAATSTQRATGVPAAPERIPAPTPIMSQTTTANMNQTSPGLSMTSSTTVEPAVELLDNGCKIRNIHVK